jgi:ankyrin repeat protein
LLLDYGADVKAREENEEIDWGGTFIRHGTPLDAAIGTKNVDLVRLLLERGAPVNTEGGVAYVPFVIAARMRSPAIVRLLLKQSGIKINATQNVSISYDEYESAAYAGEDYNYQKPATAVDEARSIGETQFVQLREARGAR